MSKTDSTTEPMTGAQHRQEAERLLVEARRASNVDLANLKALRAVGHGILALSSAVAFAGDRIADHVDDPIAG